MKFQDYLKEAVNTVAYWISPRGEVIEVDTNHIDVVIRNPQKFGYTLPEIQAVYDKYGEELGREGKAREDIILKLVEKGWVRIRRYRNEGYSVNIGKMSKKVKDVLFDWASKLLNTGIKGVKEKDKYMPVKILGFQDHFSRTLTIQDVANDALYEGEEVFDENNSVVLLESAEDLHEDVLDTLR